MNKLHTHPYFVLCSENYGYDNGGTRWNYYVEPFDYNQRFYQPFFNAIARLNKISVRDSLLVAISCLNQARNFLVDRAVSKVQERLYLLDDCTIVTSTYPTNYLFCELFVPDYHRSSFTAGFSARNKGVDYSDIGSCPLIIEKFIGALLYKQSAEATTVYNINENELVRKCNSSYDCVVKPEELFQSFQELYGLRN